MRWRCWRRACRAWWRSAACRAGRGIWAREVRELVFALDADAVGQQQWPALARQAALRGKAGRGAAGRGVRGVQGCRRRLGGGLVAAAAPVLELPEDLPELWQERAAIMAVDGGVPRAEAERWAWTALQAQRAAR